MKMESQRHPMLTLATAWSVAYDDIRKRMAEFVIELDEENRKLREEIRKLNDELVIEDELRRERDEA